MIFEAAALLDITWTHCPNDSLAEGLLQYPPEQIDLIML